jgi:RimJ/RimL family protein N-acetyltransferase
MEEDGATPQVFAVDPHGDGPVDTRGDLLSFIAYFAGEGESYKITLVAEDTDSGEVVGAVWYDKIQPEWSAFANIWMRKKYRGAVAFEAGRECLTFAFEHYKWQKIWALTHWVHSVKFAKTVGFQHVVTLPEFMIADGKPVAAHMLCLTKERYDSLAVQGRDEPVRLAAIAG